MMNKSFCNEMTPQFCFYPSLGLYLPSQHQFLEQIMQTQNHLQKEVEELRQESTKMARTVLEMRSRVEQMSRSRRKPKALKIKKVYAKNKVCQYQNCGKKYSSQIALNAHIKKAHRMREEDSSEYVL